MSDSQDSVRLVCCKCGEAFNRYLGYEEGACPICGFDSCEMCGGCCALLAFWSYPAEE